MIGIAAVAVVLGLATYSPRAFFVLLFVGSYAGTCFASRTNGRRSTPGPIARPLRLRHSIRHLMAAGVVAALILAVVRIIPAGPGSRESLAGFAVLLGGVAYLGWFLIGVYRVGPKGMAGGDCMFGFFKKQRREKLLQAPFPPEWATFLEKNVPIYRRLPEDDRLELQGLIQIFLAEKVFEGCGGLEITDEIRVTIAAQACMLLLHRDTDVYPKLVTILVYPNAYVSNMPLHSPQGIVTEGPQGRLGEAWASGVVVLSWDDVKLGAADVRDGHNVVFHEFAHQLDQEDGSADGAPILPRRNLYSAWARVLGAEYEALRRAAETGKKSVLDKYGATEPAEFFAVATECFFEKPVQLRKKHPELYDELRLYYGQDPERDLDPGPGPREK